jgi:hypothetical protein
MGLTANSYKKQKILQKKKYSPSALDIFHMLRPVFHTFSK